MVGSSSLAAVLGAVACGGDVGSSAGGTTGSGGTNSGGTTSSGGTSTGGTSTGGGPTDAQGLCVLARSVEVGEGAK